MIEKYLVLAGRIRQELDDLQKAVARAERAITAAKRNPGDQDLYIDSAALNLHDFYAGLERIFHHIASTADKEVPTSREWHRDLLRQMGMAVPQVRPEVLSSQSVAALSEYLGFRHVVRNVYTFQLTPPRVEHLVAGLAEVFEQVRADLESFLTFLSQIADQDR